MSHCIFLWILMLSLGGAPEAGVYRDYAVMRLRATNTVSGRPVLPEQVFDLCGHASWEFFHRLQDDFFDLSQTIIRAGTEEDFHRLLSDRQAVVRCAGLLALAQVKGRAAVPTIRSFLSDTGEIKYLPEGGFVVRMGRFEYLGGDLCGLPTTVGHFAWRLLLNANDLQQSDGLRPLLTDSERIALEIELLAADSWVDARPYALAHLPTVIRDGTLVLDLAVLRAHAPTLKDYQIIKGIGRLKPSSAQRDFLIACLQDNALDGSARLAAGSALTRHTDDMSLRALQNASVYLNALDEQHWGDRFLDTVQVRKAHEVNVEPLIVEAAWQDLTFRGSVSRIFAAYGLPQDEDQDKSVLLAKRTWQTPEEIHDRLVTACTCRHPLALGDLLEGRDLCAYYAAPDVWRAAGNSLVEISRWLKDYSKPWSTYADSAFLLVSYVAEERRRVWPPRILADAQRDEIEKNLAQVDGERQQMGKPPQSAAGMDGGSGR
jgi:hypothetical protein